jgi:hypothetical protein
MSFPFSVFSKKKKHVEISEKYFEYNEPKNITNYFDNQIEELIKIGLITIDNNLRDIKFIKDNINKFYKNNLAVLFLTMNIRRSSEFILSEKYKEYVKYISRVDEKNVGSTSKEEEFIEKLTFEISVYSKKIDIVMESYRY